MSGEKIIEYKVYSCPEGSSRPKAADYVIDDVAIWSETWLAYEILQCAVSKGVNELSVNTDFTIHIHFFGPWEHFELTPLVEAIKSKITEQQSKGNLNGITFRINESSTS